MKKWFANIALGLAAVAITLALLELVLWFVYPAHEVWRLKSLADAEFGWVLKPNASYRRQVPGALVRVRYNSEGYRDIDGNIPAPEGALRVVVLGDSFMEANMVPLKQVFHKQLETLAEQEGRTIRSWNLGVRGYGTLQEYMAYEKSGAVRKPDLVLVAFYLHNDVRNNAEHLNVSAQSQRGGGRKRPFLDESTEEWRILPVDFEAIRERLDKLNNSIGVRVRYGSVLLTLIRNASDALEAKAEPFRGKATLAMHMCGNGEDTNKAWATTERIFARLKQEVQHDGARLAVFSVPALFDVDMRVVEGMVNASEAAQIKGCVENSPGYKKLETILQRNAITYIDTRPAFRNAINQDRRPLFVKGDWHWNGAGHHVAARAVYDALKERNLLARP